MSEEYKEVNNLYKADKCDLALSKIENIVSQEGESKESYFYRGVIYFKVKEYEKAIKELEEAAKLEDDERVFYNLGMANAKLEQYSTAMGWLKKIIDKNPNHIPTLIIISAIFDVTGNPASAESTCRMILKQDPNNVSALNNLGNACKNSGRARDAVEAYYLALKNNPNLHSLRSNILFALNYIAKDPIALKKDHEAFAQIWNSPKWQYNTPSIRGRKIKIAFISPDFCRHSVSYFLCGIYEYIDREKFEIYSYSNTDHPDDITEWYKEKSTQFIDIENWSMEAIADKIHNDKIDIAIDLAGHTGGTVIAALGYKPAPLQITWLGYPATTGIKTIDYRITDGYADPIGVDKHYTEKLYRLPRFLNYNPSKEYPDIDLSAMKSRKYIQFGSFNNIAKLSDDTIELWSLVLKAVPNSKMLIKHKYFNDPRIQDDFYTRFKELGIEKEQLVFHSFNFTDKGHLEEYNHVDIALDSFPYNGTTTTFEALLMGVPTLTLAGKVHASRVGSAINHVLGLEDFIAKNRDDYIDTVVSITQDRNKLISLKEGLRDKLLKSLFCDSKRFVKDFEIALLEMWKEKYGE